MYQISLTDEQYQDLKHRARQSDIAPSTRDRLEMVRLSHAGWSVPRIAQHLDQHEQTVRRWIKTFLRGGFDALVNMPRGGKHSRLTPWMMEAIRNEVSKQERTWTAAQLADWVAQQYDVRLSVGRMQKHLKRAGLAYKRSSRSLHHKQKPEEVAAKRQSLQTLEKGAIQAQSTYVTWMRQGSP